MDDAQRIEQLLDDLNNAAPKLATCREAAKLIARLRVDAERMHEHYAQAAHEIFYASGTGQKMLRERMESIAATSATAPMRAEGT